MATATNEAKHIVFITPYFYPLNGGVENNCLNMALQLVAAGYKVTVLTSDRRRGVVTGRKEEEYEGITIKRLRRLLFPQYYLTFLPSLLTNLVQMDADIIHTHVPGVFWTELSLIIKKAFSRKTVFINTPHDPFMSRNNYRRYERFLRKLYLFILRRYYNWLYDYLIAVNPKQQEWITNDYGVKPEKIVTVLNGINSELLSETEIDPQLVQQYELKDKLVITNIARYHEYKGHQHVIEAINAIKNKKQLAIKYIGIGVDSGYLPRLQNYIADNKLENYITLLENPNDVIRDQILQRADIYISSSRVEAFGIGILEGMAKNSAVIASRTEGSKYLVVEGTNGLLYDFGDVAELKELIVSLAKHPEIRSKFASNNRRRAKAHTWNKTILPYLNLVSKL